MDPAPTLRAGLDPAQRLPLVVTVGFTGHRSIDHEADATAQLERAFAAVMAAFERIIVAPLAGAYHGTPRMRLLTGAAPGADRLAARVWREQAMGEIHALYPFRAGAEAFTDQPAKALAETRVHPPADAPWTGFDSASLGLEPDLAHAEVSHWIVRHADVLVGWWNGESLAAGGAGDTIKKALQRGVPVIWLAPGESELRVIDPAAAELGADADEAMRALDRLARPLTTDALAALLSRPLTPPGALPPDLPNAEAAARGDYDAVDPLRRRPFPLGVIQRGLDVSVWRSFKRFEAIAGRVPPLRAAPTPTPPAIERQPGYARLHAASAEASGRANHLSDIHRSEQLLLIGIAIGAVLVGASPALFGGTTAAHTIAALVEFALGGAAAVIATLARRARRHRRWSDARRLAERLRAATASWPMGVDIDDGHAEPPQSWTEWRARAVLRAAGPRQGWIDRGAFDEAAGWAVARLIDGQIAYHNRQHQLSENIAGAIRAVEGFSFGLLMAILFAYLVMNWLHLEVIAIPAHLLGGIVTVISATAPAVGAGCLALEATNGFDEAAQHSARFKEAFEHLKAELGEGPPFAYHKTQAIIRRGAQYLVEDADSWRDRYLRRRIVRGG
jgi:hypothetical protein